MLPRACPPTTPPSLSSLVVGLLLLALVVVVPASADSSPAASPASAGRTRTFPATAMARSASALALARRAASSSAPASAFCDPTSIGAWKTRSRARTVPSPCGDPAGSVFFGAFSPRIRRHKSDGSVARGGGGSAASAPPAADGSPRLSIEDTPLGSTKPGAYLLDGLDVHVVPASDDGHPLAVYGVDSLDVRPASVDAAAASSDDDGGRHARHPVLLLHGRTWSSVPVYHLLGGPKNAASAGGGESRSLMEALLAAGLQPYAMDFRGFGGTPRDESGWVLPGRCVRDVESVLRFVSDRHGLTDGATGEEIAPRHCDLPALLGWSQGALVAQLVAQRSPRLLSKLVLYGSIYDPTVRYPRDPLYASSAAKNTTVVMNEYDSAIEDFTVEGSIPPEPARLFAEAALTTDPVKAAWKCLHQFNNCDPARVNVPTLVVAGDQDPYAPLHVQAELFSNLGRGADRTWSIIADADHAVHLLDGRARFVKQVKNFVENGRRGSESGEVF